MSTSSSNSKKIVKGAPKNFIIPSARPANSFKSQLEIEAERNASEQDKIENDVLVTGFKQPLTDKKWLELIKHAGIDAKMVKSQSRFRSEASGAEFVTISFKDKDTQQLFMKKLKGSNLIVHERLTKFNSAVEKELRRLFRSQAIAGKKRDGSLFEAKIHMTDSWTLIDTQKTFERFANMALESLKRKDKAERLRNVDEQARLERQIVISGFSAKIGNLHQVVTKFAEILEIPLDQVVSYSAGSGEIMMELAEKSTQRKVLTSTKVIRQGDLTGDKTGRLIHWQRKLTAFNEKVYQELIAAKHFGRIAKLEYFENGFRVKKTEQSEWIVVGCENDLRRL